MKILKTNFTVLFCLCFALTKADVIPNNLFSDGAVLQQGVNVPVWGTADENETVTVQFGSQILSTIAKNGNWMVKLNKLKAGGPFIMIIKGKNTIQIKNILVGEVWLASGQSNMEKTLGPRPPQPDVENWRQEAASANYPQIREYSFKHTGGSYQPVNTLNGKWVACDTASVKKFSAVGYFFARDLYQKLKVPIGIIHSSVGGTPAEKWLSREALEANPELKTFVNDYEKAIKDFPIQLQDYKKNENQLLIQWSIDTAKARIDKKPAPAKPRIPKDPINEGNAGGLYNAMIAPLIPYAIKGVIWYQGESNSGKAKQYQTLFPALINDWRSKWQEGNFPFLFVQIAPYAHHPPEIREAQLLTMQKTTNTAMVVITDCVDSTYNLHPAQKQPVGFRLSLAARTLAYHENIEYMGPIYQSFKIEGNKVIISFTHTGDGLISNNNSDLTGFIIAGSNKKFVPAKAKIIGNTVIVYADGIDEPVAVRFGWSNKPVNNFYNRKNLPASPFRTDIEALK